MGLLCTGIVFSAKSYKFMAQTYMLNTTELSGIYPELNVSVTPCKRVDKQINETIKVGEIIWNEHQLVMFKYLEVIGFMVAQLPSAYVAENYSAKWLLFVDMFINGFIYLSFPYMAYRSYVGFLILHLIQGCFYCAVFPAMHCMIARWAPPQEIFVIGTIVYSSYFYARAFSYLASEFIAVNYGWASIFHGLGICSFIWCIFWCLLVHDSPEKQVIISAEEQKMLIRTIRRDGEGNQRLPVPWKKIFTSMPFWAIAIAHTCFSTILQNTFYVNLKYLKIVLGFNTLRINAVLGVPFLLAISYSTIFCKILDKSVEYRKFSIATGRKIAVATSIIVPGICGILICINGCNADFVKLVIAINIISDSGWMFGFYTNHIDISRKYAGTLLALTTMIAKCTQLILPRIIIFVVELYPISDIWCSLSVSNVIVGYIELIVFLNNASGEEQNWN